MPPDASLHTAGSRGDHDSKIAAAFEAVRAAHEDLTYPGLLQKIELARAPEAKLSFDPTRVDYYGLIRKALALTAQEQDTYRRTGVVVAERPQHHSMASAYLEIYRLDLPVLITTDSILHAMHRSFDNILMELETQHFAPAITKILERLHVALQAVAGSLKEPRMRTNAKDVDLYLTVARNLLVVDMSEITESNGRELQVPSVLKQDAEVKAVIKSITSLRPDRAFEIYGGRRPIDWSQFKARGHYTKSPELERYFRAMMWLGRVDLGFSLTSPSPSFGIRDAPRELRDAAVLAWLISNTEQRAPLGAVDRAVGFLVGLSDNVSVEHMIAALGRAGLGKLSDLAPDTALDKLSRELLNAGPTGQRIRSQVGFRPPGGGAETALPDVFQFFGQRFVIDSFVLSKVVFDSILFQKTRQERLMPMGLDAMAALGNDEAVALLEPQLRTFNYAANLLASRRVVEDRPAEAWNASLYDLWLSALSKLDDVPAGTAFPELMRSRAWQRKQLQTQLGSWAELRHDTILYAKQSYTMGILCEYPAGYIEPYPEFFARVAFFAEEAQRRLSALRVSTEHLNAFLGRFAKIVRKLEGLTRKELAATSFDAEEKQFVKNAIKLTVDDGGCGGPPTRIYTGWYPELIYGGKPESWEPTIADVHTDPNSGDVLEVGVGNVDFLVAAIDNRGDRAAFVGPAYSYYEFPSPQRLTDEQWRETLTNGKPAARPEWSRAFRAAGAR